MITIQIIGDQVSSDIIDTLRVYTDKTACDLLKEIMASGQDPALVRKFKMAYKSSERLEAISYNPSKPSNKETSPKATTAEKEKVLKAVKEFTTLFDTYLHGKSVRMLNTMLLTANGDLEIAKQYLTNYFTLQAHCELEKVKGDIQSYEFEKCFAVLGKLKLKPEEAVNKRFEIYFGGVGAGKSYEVAKKWGEDNIFVCSDAYTTEDLIRVFDFRDSDGTPHYKESSLIKAMREGTTIVMDEFNLLKGQAQKFFQGILDGKKRIKCDLLTNPDVIIADGFKVVGTMNLYDTTTSAMMPINMALVDRAGIIQEFVMKDELFAEIALGSAFTEL